MNYVSIFNIYILLFSFIYCYTFDKYFKSSSLRFLKGKIVMSKLRSMLNRIGIEATQKHNAGECKAPVRITFEA